jgi:alkaline phosphatase D
MLSEDWSAYRHERAEVLNYIRSQGITGVAVLCGDRHAFEAGLVSASLQPQAFDPVLPEFITASISAPGMFESAEYNLPKNHPLRAAFLYQPNGGALQPAINFSMKHGVRAGLALQRTGDPQQALAEANRELAPQLSFIDVSAHGYAVVRAHTTHLDVEFVCIPRPLQRSESKDGGPVTYRITHRVERWDAKAHPVIKRTKVEGTLPL